MTQPTPIFTIQNMLREISRFHPEVLPVIPDGVFGRHTYASVRSFQSYIGLPQTGIIDQNTWDAITKTHAQDYPSRSSPQIFPIWNITSAILPGQYNNHIYLVQAMLTALSTVFPALEASSLTGVLDQPTEQGLQWIQNASGRTETGILDAETWHDLTGLYRIIIGEGT